MKVVWTKAKSDFCGAVVFVRVGKKYITYNEDAQLLVDRCKAWSVLVKKASDGSRYYILLDIDLEKIIPRLWSIGERVVVVDGATFDVSEDKILQRIKVTKRAEKLLRLACVRSVEKSDTDDYIYNVVTMFGTDTAVTGYGACELIQFKEGWIIVKP